jgi:hypothetical protein
VATPKLDLDTAPRTAVFRQLDQMVRADATISRVFGTRIRSWTGDLSRDAKPLCKGDAPALRLTPFGLGQDAWYSPDQQFGDLGVEVELAIDGTNVDDLMNAWWAIQRAVYPSSGAQTNANALMAAGATTGMVTFVDPAFDRDQAEKAGWINARGALKVEIREVLNP